MYLLYHGSSLRVYGVISLLVFICVAALIGSCVKRKDSVSLWVKVISWLMLAILMLPAIIIATFPPRYTPRWEVYKNIAWTCYGLVEPNTLNYGIHFSEHNAEIRIPSSNEGIILENDLPSDLWVELGRTGRISIHNATLTKPQLAAIVKNRVQRMDDFSILIWADKDATTNDFNDLVLNLTTNGCNELYRVVSQPRENSKKVDFKVIFVEMEGIK